MVPSPLHARARPFRHWLAGAVTAHLPLKLAALFFALVLWLAVSAEEPTEEWVDVRVALVRDSTVMLVDSVPPVQALVVGRGRDLLKLYTTLPVLRRSIDADSTERVTLTFRPGDVDLPSNLDARVRDVRPSMVTLRLRITESRRVPVRAVLDVVADTGYRLAGAPVVEPESVTVHGPRAVVHRVTVVSTEHERLTVRDTAAAFHVPIDTTGLDVRVTPAEVVVRVAAVRDTTAGAAAKRRPAPAP